jgi:hypothetical protein
VRRRNHQLNCEALEGRQLLSVPAFYVINNASGKVLDDPNSSTRNGAVIDQWQLNGRANQQWEIVPLPDGYLKIVNVASHKVLGDPGYSTSNGTSIIQWKWNNGMNEQWYWYDSGGPGNGFALVNAYSHLAIGDPGFSNSNGTPIIQWQLNKGMNEQWTLLRADNNRPVSTHYIVNAATGTSLFNQQWIFVPVADAYSSFVIVSASSGEALDDPGSSFIAGTLVQQYTLNGGENQRWTTVGLAGNSNVLIENAISGLYLEDPVDGAGYLNPIILDLSNNSPSEQWQFS